MQNKLCYIVITGKQGALKNLDMGMKGNGLWQF